MKQEIRKLPLHQQDRVESGPLQIGEDWPGYFIRGDNAVALSLIIQDVLSDENNAIARIQLESFAKDLKGCITS